MRLPASILRELAQVLNNPRVATALAGAGGGAAAGGAYGIADSEAPGGPLGSAALGAGIGAAGLPYLLRNRMDDIGRSLAQAGEGAPRAALDGLSAESLRGLLGRPTARWEAEARAGSSVGRANIDGWRNNETLKTSLARRLQNERARSNEPDFIQQDGGGFPLWNRHTMQSILDGEMTPESTIVPRGDYLLAGGTGDARAVRRLLGLNPQQVNGPRAVQTGAIAGTLEEAVPANPRDMAAINAMRERWRAAGVELKPGEAQLVAMMRQPDGLFSTDTMANISGYAAPSVMMNRIRRRLTAAGFDAEQVVPKRQSGRAAELPGRIVQYLQTVLRRSAEQQPSFPSSQQIAKAIGSTENAVNMTMTLIRAGGRAPSLNRHGKVESYAAHSQALADLEGKFLRRAHGGPRVYGPNAVKTMPQGEQKALIEGWLDSGLNSNEILRELNTLRSSREIGVASPGTVQTMVSRIRTERRLAGRPINDPDRPLKAGGPRKRKHGNDALLALLGLAAAGGGLSTVNSEDVRRAILGRLQERI